MIYTFDQIQKMNRTARYKGAVGGNAIVPRWVSGRYIPGVLDDELILDYGAGKKAIHCQWFKDEFNKNVDAWDIGENYMASDFHIDSLPRNHYDIVYASNVFNIQPSLEGIEHVFKECVRALKPGGKFMFNYPSNPRHNPVTIKQLHGLGYYFFYMVIRDSSNPSLFIAYKSMNENQEKDLTNSLDHIHSRFGLHKLRRG